MWLELHIQSPFKYSTVLPRRRTCKSVESCGSVKRWEKPAHAQHERFRSQNRNALTFVKLQILYFEDVLQDVELLSGVVNADGAATDLAAVQHQVVVLAAHLRNGS